MTTLLDRGLILGIVVTAAALWLVTAGLFFPAEDYAQPELEASKVMDYPAYLE